MIDKLDLRVPGNVDFTSEFGKVYASFRGDPKRWRESRYYSSSASFDDCGYDVLLHMECQMTAKRMHKLEILRTGEKTLTDIHELCGRVFDYDPAKMGVMRVDLTADVEGVPVDWFKRHTLVKSKQTRRELGTVEPYMTIRKGRAETLYAGVKPNQLRIYDKVAERRMQYMKRVANPHIRMTTKAAEDAMFYKRRGDEESYAASKAVADTDLPTFEDIYGHADDAIITRVERQVAARDVEKIGMVTVADLQKADTLDPFANLIVFDSQIFDPELSKWGFVDWNAGMNLRRRVEEFGLAETDRWMKATLGKNFARAKKKWAPFLRTTDNVVGIDSERLKRLYQSSVGRQIMLGRAA